MKKVLLTTVQKPFGIENEHVMAELFHAQVTKVQDIFSLRSVYRGWGLEFIARNLKTPTTVLHFPSEREFKREVKKGYDYIGINFVGPTLYKAKKMIDIVRKESANSKIILGGYGTVFDELDEEADYVCRGEGLAFMLDLLGEKPVKSYDTPLMTNKLSCLSLPTISQTGVLFAGLGCPNGCDFCCTSHFFKQKHIPLLKTGKEIYAAMRKFDDIVPNREYSIIDEDFLKTRKRVEELYAYTSKETDRPRNFAVFSSAKSILQYSPEYLFELGVDSIWIGVESKFHQYNKNKGQDIPALFESLHKVGINTLGSMILGVDEHTPDNIWEDVDHLISMEPTLSQFIIFSPCPGTPLHDRLQKENRLFEHVPHHQRDGFHLLFDHGNFNAEELEGIILDAFQKEYRELGPSILRFMGKTLRGYQTFRNSSKPIHKARIKKLRNPLVRSLSLFGVAIRNAPSLKVRNWLVDLKAEIRDELNPTAGENLATLGASLVMPFFSNYTRFAYRFTTRHMQPKTVINRYHYAEAKQKRAVDVKVKVPAIVAADSTFSSTH